MKLPQIHGLAQSEAMEMLAGAATILALAAFIAMSLFGLRGGYSASTELLARFARADGISVGSEVRIAGVVVGNVVRQSLDEHNRAVLVLGFERGIKLDNQASASISTDGLFGGKHIDVEIGGGETDLESGGEIAYTEPALLLEDLLDLILTRARESRAKGTEGGK